MAFGDPPGDPPPPRFDGDVRCWEAVRRLCGEGSEDGGGDWSEAKHKGGRVRDMLG